MNPLEMHYREAEDSTIYASLARQWCEKHAGKIEKVNAIPLDSDDLYAERGDFREFDDYMDYLDRKAERFAASKKNLLVIIAVERTPEARREMHMIGAVHRGVGLELHNFAGEQLVAYDYLTSAGYKMPTLDNYKKHIEARRRLDKLYEWLYPEVD